MEAKRDELDVLYNSSRVDPYLGSRLWRVYCRYFSKSRNSSQVWGYWGYIGIVEL